MAKLRLGVTGAGSLTVASRMTNLERRRDNVDFLMVNRPSANARSGRSAANDSPAELEVRTAEILDAAWRSEVGGRLESIDTGPGAGMMPAGVR